MPRGTAVRLKRECHLRRSGTPAKGLRGRAYYLYLEVTRTRCPSWLTASQPELPRVQAVRGIQRPLHRPEHVQPGAELLRDQMGERHAHPVDVLHRAPEGLRPPEDVVDRRRDRGLRTASVPADGPGHL